jgi:hypothetical protein
VGEGSPGLRVGTAGGKATEAGTAPTVEGAQNAITHRGGFGMARNLIHEIHKRQLPSLAPRAVRGPGEGWRA